VIKFKKGLASSTPQEGAFYFAHMNKHLQKFAYQNEEDDDIIDMVFSKHRAEERKYYMLLVVS
jgi:DNA topoisomerase II